MLASRRNPAARGQSNLYGRLHSAAHLVRDDVSGNDLSVSQSMHAAGERLADNIAEHEDAAGYRVGDFGIASKSESVLLPGFHCHAPTITVRADIIGCLRCGYMALRPTCALLMVVTAGTLGAR